MTLSLINSVILSPLINSVILSGVAVREADGNAVEGPRVSGQCPTSIREFSRLTFSELDGEGTQ